jgi:hypothetical protein
MDVTDVALANCTGTNVKNIDAIKNAVIAIAFKDFEPARPKGPQA